MVLDKKYRFIFHSSFAGTFSPKNRLKAFYLPAIVLFILAELVIFNPGIGIILKYYLYGICLV